MKKTNCVQYFYDKNSDIELILCSDSNISYPLHNHVSVFTIGLILRGSILLTACGNSFICEKDDAFAILPYTPHIIEAQNHYTMLTLCISKNAINNCDKDKLKNGICNLLAAVREVKLTKTQITRLSACMDSFARANIPSPNETFVDAAKKQMERYPEMKLGIDEMARSLYVSKYHFIRKFKESVGLTPHQFQIQNRVRKAQHMLIDTGSITEAALAAGFFDQSHFIKQFERYVGLTPAIYKISCRNLTLDNFH